ncbi:MAG TPA: hypothetical protein PK637_00455 [Flavobacteriales bacterium]|nr:hypothetical protein [Flavobacteriales bacterium]
MNRILQLLIASLCLVLAFSWLVKPGYSLLMGYNNRAASWDIRKGAFLKNDAIPDSVLVTRNEMNPGFNADEPTYYMDYELYYSFYTRDSVLASGKDNFYNSSNEPLPLLDKLSDWQNVKVYYDTLNPTENYSEETFLLFTTKENQSTQRSFRIALLVAGLIISLLCLIWIIRLIRILSKEPGNSSSNS